MVDPNIQTIDLVASLCGISSPYPTFDVSFTFVDDTTGEKGEIFAHKLILACGSSVFMAQFYGSSKEEKDSIPVEDSSVEVFQVFIAILYNKKVTFEDMDFQQLGELFHLADKYLLYKLQNAIVQEVSSRKIVAEEVIEAVKVAEVHTPLGKFSNALHQICSSFVRDNPKSVLQIFNAEEVGEESSLTLHRLMSSASRSKSTLVADCHDYDSDTESESEDEVSEGEFECLGLYRTEVGLLDYNGESSPAGYTPMPATVKSQIFWRMNRLFASVEAGYDSSSDPDYEPGDSVEAGYNSSSDPEYEPGEEVEESQEKQAE
eukprot:GFUD01008540.1.p1 GENE.GFUD01008540.1~~GFUD01008540.1.p1  ORF type:complete len:318 (-),score=68.95 GFUD01008540.1:64-1017(-)